MGRVVRAAAGSAAPDRNLARAGVPIGVEGVTKWFRTKDQDIHALARVDLDIRAGEFVSLIGPSGCGKSTMLRIIGGLALPTAGEIRVGDESPRRARRGKRFGFVPQTPALLPWRSVADNITFLSELNSSGAEQEPMPPDEIERLIDLVGLKQFARRYPNELSGGMQQRASLVRGFALGAPVLLMDEPFSALDEITRADMRYLLLDLWQRWTSTVVFVTHSITEAVVLSDRVVVMASRPGRITHIEEIDLPRPRDLAVEDSDAFRDHLRNIRHALHEGWAA